MQTFNIQGTAEQLAAFKQNFPVAVVADRFTSTDWNVQTDDEQYADEIVDYCERNGLTCKLV